MDRSRPAPPGGALDDPAALFHFGGEPPVAGGGSEAATAARQAAAAVPEDAPQTRAAVEGLHVRGGAQPGEKVLITGIAGGQGRLIARRLRGTYAVTGVDRVPWEGHPPDVGVHVLDLRKRKMEDIFRTERPDAIVHHALIRHFDVDPRVRHEVNVLGTRRLLDFSAQHGVKRVVVMSSSYVYGALPDNPFYIDEEHPLNVSRTYPEVRDLAEVDSLATAFLWRHPEIATTILRPVPILGYYVTTSVGRFLRQRYVPAILGFNPMMQFIHEEDVAEAVALALEKGTHGVFNLVGPGAVPFHTAIRETGGVPIPVPEMLARPLFERLFELGFFPTPSGAIDFAKYPCTLDGTRFARATGFRPRFTLEDVFASVRR